MKATASNWFQAPTKNIVIIGVVIWLASTFLLVVALTNLFTENFFQRSFFIIYLLLLSSLLSVIRLYINYKKRSHLHS